MTSPLEDYDLVNRTFPMGNGDPDYTALIYGHPKGRLGVVVEPNSHNFGEDHFGFIDLGVPIEQGMHFCSIHQGHLYTSLDKAAEVLNEHYDLFLKSCQRANGQTTGYIIDTEIGRQLRRIAVENNAHWYCAVAASVLCEMPDHMNNLLKAGKIEMEAYRYIKQGFTEGLFPNFKEDDLVERIIKAAETNDPIFPIVKFTALLGMRASTGDTVRKLTGAR